MCMANGEKATPYAARHTPHAYIPTHSEWCVPVKAGAEKSQKIKTNKKRKKTKNDTTNWRQSPRMKLYKLENDNNKQMDFPKGWWSDGWLCMAFHFMFCFCRLSLFTDNGRKKEKAIGVTRLLIKTNIHWFTGNEIRFVIGYHHRAQSNSFST